jgi:hypothetical protein
MLSVMGVSWSSIFPSIRLTEILQKAIWCLHRCHHPRLLFSEIKMARSRHSRIAPLVCAFSLYDLPEAESSSHKGEFLQSRTFRGLETRAGLDPPNVLQQGRSGIARGYDDDYRA